ncbi:MAG: metal-sulfur cluster assembly factor [Elusimicrobia bacterium]|nr:metal-sulfur cluster assembly factor [Elusimicrobiota bacterium]
MDRDKLAVLTALRAVVDPEVGLDIVNMGLLYGLELTPARITARLTLTSRGCPLGETILGMAQDALEGVAGEREVRLVLSWDPPWSPRMLSEAGRRYLDGY